MQTIGFLDVAPGAALPLQLMLERLCLGTSLSFILGICYLLSLVLFYNLSSLIPGLDCVSHGIIFQI